MYQWHTVSTCFVPYHPPRVVGSHTGSESFSSLERPSKVSYGPKRERTGTVKLEGDMLSS